MHIWDYHEKDLKKTPWGRLYILQNMITMGPGKNFSQRGQKNWKKLSIDPIHRNLFRYLYMGKTLTTHFTQEQNAFLSFVRNYPRILDMFYLTGGTALSACYFNHRLSEDIDLFYPSIIYVRNPSFP